MENKALLSIISDLFPVLGWGTWGQNESMPCEVISPSFSPPSPHTPLSPQALSLLHAFIGFLNITKLVPHTYCLWCLIYVLRLYTELETYEAYVKRSGATDSLFGPKAARMHTHNVSVICAPRLELKRCLSETLTVGYFSVRVSNLPVWVLFCNEERTLVYIRKAYIEILRGSIIKYF